MLTNLNSIRGSGRENPSRYDLNPSNPRAALANVLCVASFGEASPAAIIGQCVNVQAARISCSLKEAWEAKKM